MKSKVYLNNDFIDSDLVDNLLNNRMFLYSDGFFETLIFDENNILFWEYHVNRIEKAFNVLKFNSINLKVIQENIFELVKQSFSNKIRINIYFWRNSTGLYTPTQSNVSFLIKTNELNPQPQFIERIGVSKTVKNYFSPYSFFKSNSLPYVLAGIEKTENDWDEIIILDAEGNISECLSSNIFWIKKGVYYTPSIETGCVEGIYRSYLIDKFSSEGKQVEIGKWKIEELQYADEVFSTNVTGIKILNKKAFQF